ncbi:MAG TPA: hypothetical protein VEF76_07955 [Patescibacteria group bacterium]|nr:hypothetical protein [Patescibacteria group bacterium]
MAQDKVTMQFTDTAFWNASAENGTGAYAARFVVVHPGREQEAESIRNAFKSVNGRGTRVRDGVVALTEKQLTDRIEQLSKVAGQENTVAELNRGLEHVHKLEVAHPNGPAVAAPHVTHAAKIAM